MESFSKRIYKHFKIRLERKSKIIYINIYNGLNRTFRAATVREFRPLTSTGRCGRSDRRILLKTEPTCSYQKELSYEHKRIQIHRLDLEKCQIQIWNYIILSRFMKTIFRFSLCTTFHWFFFPILVKCIFFHCICCD